MRSHVFALLAGSAFAVAACSSPSTQWNKPGASAEDLRYAQDQCAARSRGYDFVFDDRDSGQPGIGDGPYERERRAGSAQGDVYRACMESYGWQRERGGRPRPE